MRKIIAAVMVLVIAVGLFGCANGPSGQNSGSAQNETDGNIVQRPVIDAYTQREYEQGSWVDVPAHSLRSVDYFLHGNGFPESNFVINAELITGDVHLSTDGIIIKINVTYMDSDWDIWAVHVKDLTQPVRLGLPDAPSAVQIAKAHLSGHLHLYDSAADGTIPVFFNDNNVFICKEIKAASEDVMTPPYLFYFDGRENQELYFFDVDPDTRNTGEMFSFNADVNGETVFFRYRMGTTWEAWANSELNTDGWFIPAFNPMVVLNADRTAFVICSDLVMPGSIVSLSEDTAHPWREMVLDLIENGYEFDGGRHPLEEEIPRYRNRFVYCENSASPLCVTGIEIVSASVPPTGCAFWLNQGFTSSEPITITMQGILPENAEHVRVYIAAHDSDEFKAVPNYAAEVEMRYINGTMTGTYLPAEETNPDRNNDVDVLFTYDGEIVYHTTLNSFGN